MAQSGAYTGPLEKVGPCQWKIPKSYREDMRVDGLIFADDTLIEQIKKDQGPEQVVNVATLPGIQKASLAMPDIHWGYGFCIGGVAATDPEEGGVISPGGVGYDINCGVRLLRSNLEWSDVKDQIRPLVDQLFRDIPTGVGQRGRYVFHKPELVKLMEQGVSFLVDKGLGADRDLLFTEAQGRLIGADPGRVSDRAIERGAEQCGTLGSGNHFLEIQVVDRVVDHEAAEVMGLREGQIAVLIHSGLRGLGYQVCDDYLKVFKNAPRNMVLRCPTSSLPVPRCAVRKGRITWEPCARRPTSHGATASFWLTRRARSFPGFSASPGSSSGWTWSMMSRTTSPSSRITTSVLAAGRKFAFIARGRRGHFPRAIPNSRRPTLGSVSL